MLYSMVSVWRSTQVWLKGSVLKTERRRKARGGSNPSSSAIKLEIPTRISGDCYPKRFVTFCNEFLFFRTNNRLITAVICYAIIFMDNYCRFFNNRLNRLLVFDNVVFVNVDTENGAGVKFINPFFITLIHLLPI